MSPIKPERKKLYPKDWPALSLKVRQEAADRCESCGVCNGSTGYRHGPLGEFRAFASVDRQLVSSVLADLIPGMRLTRIVLTVHHADGDPTNNARANLQALCQKCHLSADHSLAAGRRLVIQEGADCGPCDL